MATDSIGLSCKDGSCLPEMQRSVTGH
ncbi:hypothetical protein R3I94_007719 [Phoxinus phoxinus]